jgi:VIT1/CCC1 family predicted Fe2+/Mn2+ transporter
VAYLVPLPSGGRFAAAALLTATALFAVGAARSLVTGLSALRSGLEMLLVGSLAAIAAYVIGSVASAVTEVDQISGPFP